MGRTFSDTNYLYIVNISLCPGILHYHGQKHFVPKSMTRLEFVTGCLRKTRLYLSSSPSNLYIAVKLTRQGTSLSYTLGESNPQVLHTHTHTHTPPSDRLCKVQGTVLKSAMFMFPSDASSEQPCLLSVGLLMVQESQTTTWHVWKPSQTMASLPYQLVSLPDFWTINRMIHPKTTNCYIQGL